MKTRRGPYSLPERGAALDVTRSGYQTWAHRDLRGGPPRAGRLLRPAGLSQKRRRQFRPLSLSDRHHDLPVAPHRLWQQPVPARPNAVGQADIT